LAVDVIPNAILRAVAAQMRTITRSDGPKLADLVDLELRERDYLLLDDVAHKVLWLKANGWARP